MPRLWRVELKQCEGIIADGEVIISRECIVFFRLFLSEDYVHCIGSNDLSDLDNIIWGIESLPMLASSNNDIEPSLLVRESLSARLAGIYQLDFRAMEVRRAKKDGQLQPPCLFYKNKKIPFDVSLSHDGQFAAYAFLLRENDLQANFLPVNFY